jgi:hypothetical protein
MKVFFDTEFTGLHKDTTLISIGCVDENGRTFYAEFTDYDKSQCDDWIQKNVIDNLVFNKVEAIINDGDGYYNIKSNKARIREAFAEWLQVYDDVELVSDVCHYDMVLLIDIFGTAFDLPRGVNAACHDINQDIARYYGISEIDAFDKSREDIVKEAGASINGLKHNSLYDAKVIKEIYEFIQ